MVNVRRHKANPLVAPADVKPTRDDFEVVCTFNAGVTTFGSETLMLIRTAERPRQEAGWISYPVFNAAKGEIEVGRIKLDDPDLDIDDPRIIFHGSDQYLTSLSHLRLARSADGVNFKVDDTPAFGPKTIYEAFGTEDPRITLIGDTYYIDYVGVSHYGVSTCLATTKDFVTYERHGMIFVPDNRDVCFFPEKINGKFAAYHRPAPKHIGKPCMYLSYSPDAIHWGEHYTVMEPGGTGWDAGRVGGGAPPIRTDKGWLSIYHAATPDNFYCLGAMLTPIDQPHKIIGKSVEPLMSPEADYELTGFFRNVCFTCGVTTQGDLLRIYYGGADTVMAMAETSISEIINDLLESK